MLIHECDEVFACRSGKQSIIYRDDSRLAPSQWDTSLQSNGHLLLAGRKPRISADNIYPGPITCCMQEGNLVQKKTNTTITKQRLLPCIEQWRSLVYWLLSIYLVKPFSGILLCMRSANKRWRYIVTLSLIGWAHTQNNPCILNDIICPIKL